MQKEEFVKLLNDARYWEDEFILKYDSEIFWELLKTLPKEKFEKIQELLKKNLSDTEYHKNAINIIIKKIEDGVYEL